MKKAKLVVVGAANSVGQEILKILAEREFPAMDVVALDLALQAGGEVSFGEKDVLPIGDYARYDFHGTNLVFLVVDGKDAMSAAGSATAAGATVIDLGASFAMDADVPLIVPEVNGESLDVLKKKIVASPCGPVVPLAVVLKALHDVAHIKRAVVTAFHAASDDGREAMDELFSQTRAIFVNDALVKERFTKQIAFNVIPQVGSFREDGETEEEWRLVLQTKKIVDPKMKVTATAIRVPVFLGHAVSVNIECEGEMDVDIARSALKKMAGITIIDHHHEDGLVTPVECIGEDTIFVSRLRDDMSCENGVNLWIVSDSLRKCAALNAVQIAEILVKKKMI